MKTILITVVLAACAALEGAAMPTKEETERAEPVVRKLMASERAALESGKKTRSEVAAAAMKLADEADTEAAKLLLMKGAFVLYVRDGNLEKAVKTMNALEKAIADMPPQCVTNMIETALLGLSKKEDGVRLYRLLDAAEEKVGEASPPPHDGEVVQRQATVGGYTWSYRVNNGEAAIVAEKDGKFSCAVSPSPKGDVTIPSTLGGKRVTRIGQSAFKGCNGLTSVTIPSDVKNIGPTAFEGCSGLTSMAIPDGVKTIENCAFWGCDGLKSVMIPPSVTTISDAAFGYCGGLTSMTIPPTVKELRTQVFFGCGALKSVTIPASVEKIGWAAFVYSGKLKEINVEQGNQWFTSVDGVLYTKDMTELVACPNALTSLTIPSSVKKLRDAAIISCGKLESLTIPEGVTDIGWQAIKDCGSLKTVTIPSTVRSIAEIAFCNCGSLTSVTIPAGVVSIGKRAFENCGGLTSVTMCGERPEASDDVFKGCGNLKAILVSANAKSWAGMKEWQGVPLVFAAEVAPTAVSLAQICNTNGLVHCWRFNGSLKDEIGGGEAKLEDGAKLGNGYVSKRGKSNIDLGGQMLPAADNLTIELWVKANKVHDWDRLFVFGSDYNNRLTALWSWWGKSSLEAIYNGNGKGQGLAPHFGTFAAGVEYHVALVIEQAGKHCRATTYRQNAQTGEILSRGSMLIESGWSPKSFVHKDSWLGKLYGGECNSDVCYNEVRIWDRALGEKELKQNALKFHEAGETMKDSVSNTTVNGVKWNYEIRGDGVVLGGEGELAVPTNTTGALVIPAAIDGKPVREIGVGAFQNCTGLTSVTIPSSVKSIGKEAFHWCGGLTSVTMCGERPEAPDNVFTECDKLVVIHVPADATSWSGMKTWQGIPIVFDAKRENAKGVSGSVMFQATKDRTTVQSILDGMIKVPGRDYWLSETELTQGQWEAVMGYNLSTHKGANLPVENVSRDECAVFLEKLNETKEVLLTRFEFGLPTLNEWTYAAQAGGSDLDCWIKPGVVGDVFDMAWVAENSSNQTHVVATKAANAFGFYDMLGNVWEWMNCKEENVGCRHGGSFRDPAVDCTVRKGFHNPRNRRFDCYGLRVAAHIRSAIEICPDEK